MIRRSRVRLAVSPEVRLSLRAAFCLSAPLIIGLIVHQRLYAIVAGIGALWAVSQDGLDSWRVRGPRLLWVAGAGGAGVGLGSAYVDHFSSSLSLVLLVAGVAFVAGFIEASHHATAGAYFLIGTVMGVGLQFTGVEWQSTLAIVTGALWVYAVAALMNHIFHLENQRIVLAAAFRALANNIDALGAASFHSSRAASLASVDHAQDVVGTINLDTSNAEERSLYQCLIVALRSGEVISYVEGKDVAMSSSVAPALRNVARTLLSVGAIAAATVLDSVRESFLSSPGLSRAAADTLRLDLTILPHQVTRFSTTPLLPVRERLRFAAIVTCAVTLAMIISRILNGPHGFWLPLAVAFILRPDVGPVITRALARTVGTALGVGIAALVALSGNTEIELIILSCVMASIQPGAQRRSHALAVMTFTPIVFVFLGLIGESGDLFGVRILDTALGAVIVLLVDVLLWTTAPSLRPERQLDDARSASARYGADSPTDDPIRRNQLRRAALRAVARVRVSVSNARSEPRLLGRYNPANADQLDAIEHSIDQHTVTLLERHSD
ncbi:MAG: FUSC family protein [Acidimicrobiales bacterium]